MRFVATTVAGSTWAGNRTLVSRSRRSLMVLAPTPTEVLNHIQGRSPTKMK